MVEYYIILLRNICRKQMPDIVGETFLWGYGSSKTQHSGWGDGMVQCGYTFLLGIVDDPHFWDFQSDWVPLLCHITI